MADNWIAGAVRHKGALTEAAKRAGKSKQAEAETESHSGNPKTRGRGILGMRFLTEKRPAKLRGLVTTLARRAEGDFHK